MPYRSSQEQYPQDSPHIQGVCYELSDGNRRTAKRGKQVSENATEGSKEYQPPARQLWTTSRPVNCKVAPRKRSSSTRPVSRPVSQATPPPDDDSEDMLHSTASKKMKKTKRREHFSMTDG
ncbi:hypothetical protein AMECASPLE_025370 [Ameca splendens]|uniref:Uncharacterized protein n=1 Tax=Ameca splendens TaxID=208324 RepID=A0ABV0YFT0_9TELE